MADQTSPTDPTMADKTSPTDSTMADKTSPTDSTMADQTSPTDSTTPTTIPTTPNDPAPPASMSTTPAPQPAAPTAPTTPQVPTPAHTAANTTGPRRTLAEILHSYHARATPEQQRDWAVVAPYLAASQHAGRPLMFVATFGELDVAPQDPPVPRRYVVAVVSTVCVGCLVGVGIAWMQSRWAPIAGWVGGLAPLCGCGADGC